MYIEKIKETFPEAVFQNISQIKFVYEGLHNYTFQALYQNQLVQIRIVKAFWVQRQSEIALLSQMEQYLFVDMLGNFIKTWVVGSDLAHIDNFQNWWQKVLQAVKKFHQINWVKNDIIQFDWNLEMFDDFKFQTLVQKYYTNLENSVVAHNDLRPKNVILDSKWNIHLIDFEWVRINHPYFDFASLHLYFQIPLDYLVSELKLDIVILEDFIYLVDTFNKKWQIQKY